MRENCPMSSADRAMGYTTTLESRCPGARPAFPCPLTQTKSGEQARAPCWRDHRRRASARQHTQGRRLLELLGFAVRPSDGGRRRRRRRHLAGRSTALGLGAGFAGSTRGEPRCGGVLRLAGSVLPKGLAAGDRCDEASARRSSRTHRRGDPPSQRSGQVTPQAMTDLV